MKQKTKKFFSLFLIVMMLFGILPASAFAADTKTYLVLGDSISTGYGLSDASAEAFPVLLTNQLGEDFICENKAVDGEKTATLLEKLLEDSDYQNAVERADVITITIGGNDLMDLLYAFLADALKDVEGIDVENVDDVKAALESGDTAVLTAAAEVVNATEGGFTPTPQQLNAVATNVASIISEIKTRNSDVTVMVATQYHPYTELTEEVNQYYSMLPMVAPDYVPLADAIITLSGNIETVLETGVTLANETASGLNDDIRDAQGACLVADVYAAFEASGSKLCNADLTTSPISVNLDFHPNAAGHVVIADCMAEVYEASAPSQTYVSGDVNHDELIDSRDARLVLRYSVGDSEAQIDTTLADYNGDGNIDSRDARAILLASV